MSLEVQGKCQEDLKSPTPWVLTQHSHISFIDLDNTRRSHLLRKLLEQPTLILSRSDFHGTFRDVIILCVDYLHRPLVLVQKTIRYMIILPEIGTCPAQHKADNLKLWSLMMCDYVLGDIKPVPQHRRFLQQ